MTLKGRTLSDWLEWLDDQLSGRGEQNFTKDEIYVLEAFQEAVMELRGQEIAREHLVFRAVDQFSQDRSSEQKD